MNSTLWSVALCAALTNGLDRPAIEEPQLEDSPSDARALVVGVGKYENDPTWNLAGPENDAKLVQSLLVDHLGFAPERVKVLSTALGPDDQPTRARILAELSAMAAARPEFAVVYLSGHGSFVPDQEGEGRDEVDGTDEVFLPADARAWDESRSMAENVLLDDEIDAALTRLEDAGSFVWFWTDSCSSGTQDRGEAGEVREVSPSALGIPADASARVGLASGLDEVEEFSSDADGAGRRVVFTACRSYQKAKSEDAMHPLDPDLGTVRLGVFTRLVAREIANSEFTVTYQDVINRVEPVAPNAQRPTATGSLHTVLLERGERRYDVTPVEGAWRLRLDVDASDGVEPGASVRVEIYENEWVDAQLIDVREETAWIDLDPVWEIRGAGLQEPRAARLGERELEAQFAFDEARYEVSAGSLADVEHGDTFLAEWGDGEKAQLRVVDLRLDRAFTVALGGDVVLGEDASARLVLQPRPRRIAILENGASDELVAAARAGVRDARLTLADPADAHWFLELRADRHVLRLGASAEEDAFWVGLEAEDVASALERVFRAENLRRLGVTPRVQPPTGLRAELCTRAGDELDPANWSPIDTRPISPGTWAGLRVTNSTGKSYTASMFILDGDRGVDPVEPDTTDRRIVRPGATDHRFRTDELQFFDDDQGPAEVLVLFVEDDRTSAFGWLRHPPLDRVVGPVEGSPGAAFAFTEFPAMRSGDDEVGHFLQGIIEQTRGGASSPDGVYAQLLTYEVGWDLPVLAGAVGPEIADDRKALVRALLSRPAFGLDADALQVSWVAGHEGTCALADDGVTCAVALDLDGDAEGAWQPELVLLERDATRTVIELDADGASVRKRLDVDGDGMSERVWRRSPAGWAEVPGGREPLLLLADMQLGEREWPAVERARAVFAALQSSSRTAWAAPRNQDPSSSFAPESGGAGAPESGAPVTQADVQAIVDELVEALEEDLPVPLEVALLEDGQVNARAWREEYVGKIEIYRGLIDAFGGDVDLLRAVIAHELVHVVEVHSIQRTGAMDLDLHLMRVQETQADLEGADLLEAAGHPRRDLTRALGKLDAYTKSGQVLWHQIVSGDHPSFYARIAALEPESTAARALTAFERGLAFLECRRPDAARIAFERALSLAPELDEARFNLVRAELQSYYEELPASLRDAWLDPEFGPVLTEVSSVEVRGAADLERYLELVRLANELPEGVRDPQRAFLRGTIFVLHPEGERESLERGFRLLAELGLSLEGASGDQGSALVATGDPSDPTTSRLALMPLSTKELRLQAFTNMAVGLHRLGRGELAWETLMGAVRSTRPWQPPTSLATNLARLRPPELEEGDRSLLVDYLQLRYQTVNPGSQDHVRCKTALEDLAPESLASLYEAGPRYAPPTRMRVLGGELELHLAFARDDARFGKPASAGPLTPRYQALRYCRWKNPDGEGDLVIFSEDDRIVQVTSSVHGASLTLTPAEGRPGVDSAEVQVGMTADELDGLLGNTYRYHSLRNPYPAKGKITASSDERWRYYAHLNLGVLVIDDVAEAVTVTAALR